jgi:hypothetical protein
MEKARAGLFHMLNSSTVGPLVQRNLGLCVRYGYLDSRRLVGTVANGKNGITPHILQFLNGGTKYYLPTYLPT